MPPHKRRGVSAFIRNTYQILKDSEHQNIICWAEDGNGFIIRDVELFSERILPKYFKHKKYTSFVRQLNMYGFHKSRQYNTENYFSHELFKRDQLDPIKFLKQLSEIERKPEKKKKGEDHCQADKTSLYILESMESMDDQLSLQFESQEQKEDDKKLVSEEEQQAENAPKLETKQISNPRRQLVVSDNNFPPQIQFQNEQQQLNFLMTMLVRQNQSLRRTHQLIRNQVLESKNRQIVMLQLQKEQQEFRTSNSNRLLQEQSIAMDSFASTLMKQAIHLYGVYLASSHQTK